MAPVPLLMANGRWGLSEGTFAATRGKEREAPIPAGLRDRDRATGGDIRHTLADAQPSSGSAQGRALIEPAIIEP